MATKFTHHPSKGRVARVAIATRIDPNMLNGKQVRIIDYYCAIYHQSWQAGRERYCEEYEFRMRFGGVPDGLNDNRAVLVSLPDDRQALVHDSELVRMDPAAKPKGTVKAKSKTRKAVNAKRKQA